MKFKWTVSELIGPGSSSYTIDRCLQNLFSFPYSSLISYFMFGYVYNSNVTVAPWNNQSSDTSTFDRLRDTCNKMFLRDGHLRGSSQFALSPTLPRVSPTFHFRFSYHHFYFFFFSFHCSILYLLFFPLKENVKNP